jgi:cytoskeletal protein CcmA (bactofilin family)
MTLFNKKAKSKNTKIDTLIGQNSEIHGDIQFDGGLHIDGTVIGNIFADDHSGSVLSLSEKGTIEGEVKVPNLIVNGLVIGNIFASGQIELAEKARIKGNVYYQYLEMVKGAEINGSLIHGTGVEHEQLKIDDIPQKNNSEI